MSGRIFTLPPATVTSTVVGGIVTAIFPGVPYKRRLNSLVVDCTSVSSVSAYRSSVATDSSLIAKHPIGNQNTYMPVNRDEIPSGFPVVVQWPNAGITDVGTATAVFEGSYD